MTPALEQTYAAAIPELSLAWRAAAAPEPRLVVLDESVAATLGLDPDWLRSPEGVAFLVGDVPESVPTFAQAYAGHQFGGYSPRLGDGRALLLGEVVGADGQRRDLHLKGSGRTPFSRGGDGLAVLGPMLREHLMGAAMHALGIPTTRSLAVCTTGERVFRDGRMLPGAVLARVASSHLRVGTFQYAAANGGPDLVRRLADHAVARHYPDLEALTGPARYLAFYEAVCARQADLVAAWMSVGFVHGVMNTDNMSIAGQTIDYGPCAFLDAYDPDAAFSSIDTGGRYAYGQQPGIAQWNLARLGETLLPLLADDANAAVDAATSVLTGFAEWYDAAATARMAAKLGLVGDSAVLRELVGDLLELLRAERVDFTGFFRALAAGSAAEMFTETARFDAWAARWEALLPEGREAAAEAMNRVDPVTIPRNHRVDAALEAAQAGDLAPFTRLLDAVTHPYEEREEWADLATPAPPDAPPFVTYCGT